ncbi:MAG: sugar phosphate isomerase/epimerase [Clostridia bacterium]|nr:sugar phosphate isomerase/epimerase [Clostridia bacterium]
MKIAVNSGILNRVCPLEESLELIKAAGFDGVEISLDRIMKGPDDWDTRFQGENYLDEARKLKKFIDELGLEVAQVCAPSAKFRADYYTNPYSYPMAVRSIEIAAELGAPVIIIKPIDRPAYFGNEEKLFETSMDYYGRFAPIAERCGIKIALENVCAFDFRRHGPGHHICSKPEEHIRYLTALNEAYPDRFVACMDMGEPNLVCGYAEENIRALGSRIACTHVHDNHYRKNDHCIPGHGVIDFHAISEALKEIGYEGYYTLNCAVHLPRELMPSALSHMATVARYFAEK